MHSWIGKKARELEHYLPDFHSGPFEHRTADVSLVGSGTYTMEPNGEFGFQPPAKMAKTAAGTSAGSSSTGTVLGGGSKDGVPELAKANHARKVDKMTLTYAGTTWIDAAADGTNNNVWGNFPWEYPRIFTTIDKDRELFARYLYWKCSGIHLKVQNPVCVQNIGTTAAGLVQTGQNNQAQLFGYIDNMYLTGVSGQPGPATTDSTGATFDVHQIGRIRTSWRNHGYEANVPVSLPSVTYSSDLIDATLPDVKNIGMGPGQAMDFSWDVTSKFWRATAELQNNNLNATSPGEQFGTGRWDEHLGTVGSFAQMATAATTSQNATDPLVFLARGQGQTFPIHTTFAPNNTVWQPPMTHLHVDPDPIPKVWFQLQPQISSLEAGTGTSKVQVQWQLDVDILLTGKVPKWNGLEAVDFTRTARTEFARQMISINTNPLFIPWGTAFSRTNAA